MQTVSSVGDALMPYVKNELSHRCFFYFIPKRLYQHFISFGKTIDDLFVYSSLREAFSQRDLAELEFYNSFPFSGDLYKNLRINPDISFNSLFGSHLNLLRATPQNMAEYENAIKPMIALIQKEYSENKAQQDPRTEQQMLENPSWRILPTANRLYYLIVVDTCFFSDLRIRSQVKRLVSECLQIDIAVNGLVNVQRSPLYEYYLKLLQLEVNQVELLS
jgi:hypothetical protein